MRRLHCTIGSVVYQNPATKRVGPMALCIALLLGACGGGEMSLSEYAESVNAIFESSNQRFEAVIASPGGGVLVAEGAELRNFTPNDLHIAFTQVAEIQADALETAAAIDPPEPIAEYHRLFFRELPVAEVAALAGGTADWEELSASPEMAVYRAALAEDKRVCAEFQAALDALAGRVISFDSPWIAGVTDILDDALGCNVLPENPEDAFRP